MENHPTDILANYKVKAIETMWYWQRNLRKTGQKDIPETEPCTYVDWKGQK